jgi:hypothetical protein
VIFFRSMIFLPFFFLSCSSFGSGRAEIDSAPLSEKYKKFREKPRRLYIQNFDNRTYSPQLTGRLKEKLQLAYTRLQSLAVTPDKGRADLVLYGKIEQYVEDPGVFDRNSQPLSYNLTMIVSVRLRARGASTREEDTNDLTEQHDLAYMTSYNIGEPFYETRYTAEERLLEGLADRIVSSTYEPKPEEVKKP